MTGESSADGDRSRQDKPPFLSDEELMEAWEYDWPGISLCSLANDLGEDELREGTMIGHQTDAGIFHSYGHHRWYERSHMRLVSHTVGTPISQFQSTKEMVIALRDAIRGKSLRFRTRWSMCTARLTSRPQGIGWRSRPALCIATLARAIS